MSNPNNVGLTEEDEQEQAKEQGQQEFVTGVIHNAEVPKSGEGYASVQSLYQKTVGVTKYDQLRKKIGLSADESYTDWYKRNGGYVPTGFENDSRALLAEEKAKKYYAQYEAGEIGYSDFLMNAYGKDIMKANGDDLTSSLYWYNRAAQGLYGSPLDNDYYFNQVIGAAEAEYQASEWYNAIYTKDSNDLLNGLCTGVTLNADQFSEIFPAATEALSEYFENNVEKMMTYYKAGYLDASVFNPLIDTDKDGTYDYYYHTDGRIYALEGSSATGNAWAKAYYVDKVDANGNKIKVLDRVVVDSWLGKDGFGEYMNEFLGGLGSFWGGIVDIFAMIGAGVGTAFGGTWADHYAEWEAIKNSTVSLALGGVGNVHDFGGLYEDDENGTQIVGGETGDDTGRGVVRAVGMIVPMIIMTAITFGGGDAAYAGVEGAKQGLKATMTAARQAGKSAAKAAVKYGLKGAGKFAIKGVQTLSGMRGGNPAITNAIAGAMTNKVASMTVKMIGGAIERGAVLAAKDTMSTYISLQARQRELQYLHDNVDSNIEVYDQGYMVGRAMTVGATNAMVSMFLGAMSGIGGMGDRVSQVQRALASSSKSWAQNLSKIGRGFVSKVLSSTSTAGLIINTASDVLENIITQTTAAWGAQANTSWGEALGQTLSNPSSWVMNLYIMSQDLGMGTMIGNNKASRAILGSSSLKDDQLLRVAGMMDWNVELVQKGIQTQINKATDSGDTEAIRVWTALANKFQQDLTAPYVMDGDTKISNAYAVKLEALSKISEVFEGADNTSILSGMKTYLSEDSFAQVKALLDSGKATSWVEALYKNELRDNIKKLSMAQLEYDRDCMNLLYGADSRVMQTIFYGDPYEIFSGNPKEGAKNLEGGPLTAKERAQLRAARTAVDGIAKMFRAQDQRLADVDSMVNMRQRAQAVLQAKKLYDGAADDAAFNERFSANVKATTLNGKLVTATDEKGERKVTFKVSDDEYIDSAFGNLTAPENRETLEAMKQAGIIGESDSDANPLIGAMVFRAMTPEEYGASWNDKNGPQAADSDRSKMVQMLDYISSLWGMTDGEKVPMLNYSKPLIYKANIRGKDGEMRTVYIIPHTSAFARSQYVAAAGAMIRAAFTITTATPDTAAGTFSETAKARINDSLVLLGMLSDENTAEDPILALKSIPTIEAKRTALRDMGIRQVLGMVQINGKDDSNSLMPRAQLMTMIQNDLIPKNVVEDLISRDTGLKKIGEYIENFEKIYNEINPALEKIKKLEKGDQDRKTALTLKEKTKVEEFIRNLKAKGGMQSDVFKALVNDGAIRQDLVEQMFTRAPELIPFSDGQDGRNVPQEVAGLLSDFSEASLDPKTISEYFEVFGKVLASYDEVRLSALTTKLRTLLDDKDFKDEFTKLVFDYMPASSLEYDATRQKVIPRKTQETAVKAILNTIAKVKSYAEYETLYRELINNPADGEGSVLYRELDEHLRRSLEGASPDNKEKYTIDDTELRAGVSNAIAEMLDPQKVIVMLSKQFFDGAFKDDAEFESLLNMPSSKLRNYIQGNPEFSKRMFELVQRFVPTREDLSYTKFIEDPTSWMMVVAAKLNNVERTTNRNVFNKFINAVVKNAGGRVLIWDEVSPPEQLQQWTQEALRFHLQDTVALLGEKKIRINLNEFHGKSFTEIIAKSATAGYMKSFENKPLMDDYRSRQMEIYHQEKAIHYMMRKTDNGIIEFDLSTEQGCQDFEYFMKQAGYSGREVLASGRSDIVGVYNMSASARGVAINMTEAEMQMFRDRINEAARKVEPIARKDNFIDMHGAIDELVSNFTYIDEDTVLQSPRIVLDRAASISTDEPLKLATGLSKNFENLAVKLGIAASHKSDSLLRMSAGIHVHSDGDTDMDKVIKVLSYIDTLANAFGKENEIKSHIIVQEFKSDADAKAVVEYYKNNTIWDATQDGTKVTFHSKANLDDKTFKANAIVMLSDGKHYFADILPLVNPRIQDASNTILTRLGNSPNGEAIDEGLTNAAMQGLAAHLKAYSPYKPEMSEIIEFLTDELSCMGNYTFDEAEFKLLFDSKNVTVGELLKLASNESGGTKNFYIKNLANVLRMGTAITKSYIGGEFGTPAMTTAFYKILGDKSFRTALGNALNEKRIEKYSDLEGLDIDELVNTVYEKWHRENGMYESSTNNDGAGSFYNPYYIDANVLSTIGTLYRLDDVDAREVMTDVIKNVILMISSSDFRIPTSTDKLAYQFQSYNPSTKLLYLLREGGDGKYYLDTNMLDQLTEKEIDILRETLGSKFENIQKKLDMLEPEIVKKPVEERMAFEDNTAASTIITDFGFDTPEVRARLVELMFNRLQNKDPNGKPRIKSSAALNSYNENDAIVRYFLKRLKETVLGNMATDKPGSIMIANMNNRKAAGEYMLSLISLAEAIRSTHKANGNNLFGNGKELSIEDAYEIAETIAMYSNGTDYSSEYTRYLVFDEKAPKGKRVRVLGMRTDDTEGMSNMMLRLLTGKMDYDEETGKWKRTYDSILQDNRDGRKTGLVLIDVSKNALNASNMFEGIKYADLNNDTVRHELLTDAMVLAVQEYKAKYENTAGITNPTTREMMDVVYSRAFSSVDMAENLFEAVQEVFPGMPEETVRALAGDAMNLQSASSRATLSEEAFYNYLSAFSMYDGAPSKMYSRESEINNDIITFGVHESVLPEGVRRAFGELQYVLEDELGMKVTTDIRDISDLLLLPQYRNEDGKQVISSDRKERDTQLKVLVDRLTKQGAASNEEKVKALQTIVAYTITSRLRGKDINAVLMGKGIYQSYVDYLNSKVSKTDDFTKPILINRDGRTVTFEDMLERGYIGFDIESFYKNNDNEHNQSKVYQIAFAEYDPEIDASDRQKKPSKRTVLYIAQEDTMNVAIKKTGAYENDRYYFVGEESNMSRYRNIVNASKGLYNENGIRVLSAAESGTDANVIVARDEAAAAAYLKTYLNENVATSANQSGKILLGYNSSKYDIPVLEKRIFGEADALADYDHLDVLRDVVRGTYSFTQGDGKHDSLDSFRTMYGVGLETGHDALEDIIFMIDVMKRHIDGIVNISKMKSALGEDISRVARALLGKIDDGKLVEATESEALAFLDNNFQNDDTVEKLYDYIIKNVVKDDVIGGKAINSFINGYRSYGDTITNEGFKKIIDLINNIRAQTQWRVNRKVVYNAESQMVKPEYINFARHFVSIDNQTALARVITAIANKLHSITVAPNEDGTMPAIEWLKGDNATEGALLTASRIISEAARVSEMSVTDRNIMDFLMRPLDDQVQGINEAIERMSIGKGERAEAYKAMLADKLTVDEVNGADITDYMNAVKVYTDTTGAYGYTDKETGRAFLNAQRMILDRKDINTAWNSFAYTLSPMFGMMTEGMNPAMQKLFVNMFASIYGKDYSTETLRSNNLSLVLQSKASEGLKTLLKENHDYTLNNRRLYDMMTPLKPGQSVKCIDSALPETVQPGTIYLSKKEFLNLYGGRNVTSAEDLYASLLNAVGGTADGSLYVQAMRHPGFREDILHTVRIKVVEDGAGINTFAAEPNWFFALCSGDFDGDNLMMFTPTRDAQAFGRAMHELNQQGWRLANDILSDIYTRDYDFEANRAVGQLICQEERVSREIKDTWSLVNDKSLSFDEKMALIDTLKETLKEAYTKRMGTDHGFSSVWKALGISWYDDSATNATEGGIKFFSTNPLLNGDEINQKNRINKYQGSGTRYETQSANASITGVDTKTAAQDGQHLHGEASDILLYAPVQFTDGDGGTIERMSFALEDDTPDANGLTIRAKIAAKLRDQAVKTSMPNAINELAAKVEQQGDVYSLVNAIQLIENELRSSSNGNEMLVNALRSINQDDLIAQENAKLAQAMTLLNMNGISPNELDLLRDAGLDKKPDANDYFGLKRYRAALMNAYMKGRPDEYKFSGAVSPNMRDTLANAILDYKEDADFIGMRIYNSVGDEFEINSDGSGKTFAAALTMRVLLDNDTTGDGLRISKKFADKNKLTSMAFLKLSSTDKITQEAIDAYQSGKPLPAGTKIIRNGSGLRQDYDVMIQGFADRNGRPIESADDLKYATRVLVSRVHNFLDQEGGYKLSLTGSGALKGTVAGTFDVKTEAMPATKLPAELGQIDAIANVALFNQGKIPTFVDSQIEEIEVNGKKYQVLTGKFGLAASTAGWKGGIDTSEMDDITLVNASSAGDAYLMVGRHHIYVNDDGTIDYDTNAAAQINRLLKQSSRPEYQHVNAAPLFRLMQLYYLTEDAIRNSEHARSEFLKHIGKETTKPTVEATKRERDAWIMQISKAPRIGGFEGVSEFNTLVRLMYRDNSEVARAKERLSGSAFTRALFSTEMAENFENRKLIAAKSRDARKLFANKNKPINGMDDRYFSLNGSHVGESADATAVRHGGYKDGSLGFYPMLNFINDMLYITQRGAKPVADEADGGYGYLTSKTVQTLTENGILNVPEVVSGHIDNGYNPISTRYATRIENDPSATHMQAKLGTSIMNTGRADSFGTQLQALSSAVLQESTRNAPDYRPHEYRYAGNWNDGSDNGAFGRRFAPKGNYDNEMYSKLNRRYNADDVRSRATSEDRAASLILAATSGKKTRLGIVQQLAPKQYNDVVLNTQENVLTPVGNELNWQAIPITQRMEADQVLKTINSGSHNYFDTVDRNKQSVDNSIETLSRGKNPALQLQGADELVREQNSDVTNLTVNDDNFAPGEYAEKTNKFFSAQKQVAHFVNELYSNDIRDTDVEKAAMRNIRLAGGDPQAMKRSLLSSARIKAAMGDNESKAQAIAIERAIVSVGGEERMVFNQMLGSEYLEISQLVGNDALAQKNFKKYTYLLGALAKWDYMQENPDALRKEIDSGVLHDRTGKRLSYEEVLEQARTDIGDVDAARQFIENYELGHSRIVNAVYELNQRVKAYSDEYSRLTNQPLVEWFWYMMPQKEITKQELRDARGRKKKGDVTLLHRMTVGKTDRNLQDAVMNRHGRSIDEVYMGYDYLSSLAENARQLSRVISIVKTSDKLRRANVMNNSAVIDIANDVMQAHLNDLVGANVTRSSLYRNVGPKGMMNEEAEHFKTFWSSVESLGVNTARTRQLFEEEGAASTSVGQKYAAIYTDLMDYINKDASRYSSLTFEELASTSSSATNDQDRIAIETAIKVKSAMNDVIVKLSQLQDKVSMTEDGKKRTENIMQEIYRKLTDYAKENNLTIVDRFGRKLDIVEGKEWYSLSEDSIEYLVRLTRYNTQSEGGRKANAVLDALNGDLFFMDSFAADNMAKLVFTKVEPGKVRKIANTVKNLTTSFIMASPVKMLSRLFNFTVSDIGFALSADPKVGLYLADAARDIKAFLQSGGKSLSDDLKSYINLVGASDGMFYGEKLTNSKHGDPISQWFNIANKAFNAQTMYVRLALFKSLSKKFNSYGDGEIPAHLFGADYRKSAELNSLKGVDGIETQGLINGQGASRAQVIASKIIADTFGNSNDMPYAAQWLSQHGFAFTTFPLALVRFGINEVSSLATAARDVFLNTGAGRKSAAWYLVKQGLSAAAAYALAATIQLLLDPEARETLEDAVSGEEMSEEDWEVVKNFFFQKTGAVKPFESMLANETQKNASTFLNPAAMLRDMFYDPFADAAEGKTSYGVSSDVSPIALSFVNFVNTNLYSALPPLLQMVTNSLPSNTMFGYTFDNDDYSFVENFARRLGGYMVGSEVVSSFINDWKTSGYEEDNGFLNRVSSGLQRAFVDDMSNSKQYKSTWKNYRNAFSIVYNYKLLNNTPTANYTPTDPSFDELSAKIRLALQNRNSPTAIYNIIDEAKANGTALATIRSALRNNSLNYKISQLDDQGDFIDSLSDSEANTIKSALAYEEQIFPFLDDMMEDVERQYIAAGGYSKPYYSNVWNTYYNGYFHNLPTFSGYTNLKPYSYSGFNNFNMYNKNYDGGRTFENPFDAYRESAARLQNLQYQLERKKQEEQYADYSYQM